MTLDKIGVRVLRAVPADADNGHSSVVFPGELLDRGSFKVATDSTGCPEPQSDGSGRQLVIERQQSPADDVGHESKSG